MCPENRKAIVLKIIIETFFFIAFDVGRYRVIKARKSY